MESAARGGEEIPDLHGADLSEADLRRAVLRRAVLRRAVLSEAVLSGATLSGANLSGTKLGGAILSGAKGLTRAQIESAQGDAHTELPEGMVRPANWVAPPRSPLLPPADTH